MPCAELAYAKAAEADAKFEAGEYISYVQGIPFAIKARQLCPVVPIAVMHPLLATICTPIDNQS